MRGPAWRTTRASPRTRFRQFVRGQCTFCGGRNMACGELESVHAQATQADSKWDRLALATTSAAPQDANGPG
jgi:hypothetical protein